MSTHKYIDRICCIVLAVTIVITVLFMCGENLGLAKRVSAAEYEAKIFDTSKVHTIDIVIDDWDSFLETCTDEEYTVCSVVIDNEAYKNVAIRAKGNTSLTQVQSYGNNRYSFKIEFDHYDSTKNYYGLDKLCLNNIIQDNTYMKDFLCYRMMAEFGVDSPLCSYVYITVNGEDWGLYLAVEGVEDAFLERNYSGEDGELYKPDSQSMGGGRGNGGDFKMDDFEGFDSENSTKPSNSHADENTASADNNPTAPKTDEQPTESNENNRQDDVQPPQGGMPQMPDDMPNGGGGFGQNMPNGEIPQMPQNGQMPQGSTPSLPESLPTDGMQTESMSFTPNNGTNSSSDSATQNSETPEMPDMPDMLQGNAMEKPDNIGDNGMNGSDDVSLIYSDDSYSSYQNIFDNAKTDITNADKDRLIASLKKLNNNEDIADVVDVDEVIRYFVVHNFVCNFDSYTGSMIHNYYLYENDGQMSMIPWDYNLAFGGFMGSQDATALVNYPIDSPVSGGTVDSRPMLAWIFANEEYAEKYHTLFSEFIEKYFENGYVTNLITSTKEMISEYVEKDPTKFCTFEEFESGVSALESFCSLKAESIRGQLDGTIPSTSEEQKTVSTSLIDASNLNISNMGTMNNSQPGGMENFTKPSKNSDDDSSNSNNQAADGNAPDEPPNGESSNNNGTPPELPDDVQDFSENKADKFSSSQNDESTKGNPSKGIGNTLLYLALSIVILFIGILIAFIYKKKR